MRRLQKIASFFRNTWFTARFFAAFAVPVILFCLSFIYPICFVVAQTVAILLAIVTFVDIVILYRYSTPFTAERSSYKLLSNGDDNPIKIHVENQTNIDFKIDIYDEQPYQLQKRDFHFGCVLKANDHQDITYVVHPTERGSYEFGAINIFLTGLIGMVRRRQVIAAKKAIPVYPSIIQMKKFELKAMEKTSHFYGIKKIRRIGQSYEFEQIRSYVQGDDFRKINWKATSKQNSLMINQYVEERSQMVYCFLDKSRNMKMPFYGLSLFDYALNTSLVLSNIALQKQDKAGLVSFSDKIDALVKASNKNGQLRKILETLYNQKGNFVETNYELLYIYVRRMITTRSLIFLFTNFESTYNLERNINVIRKLAKLHLLVVVFFENTEISHYLEKDARTLQDMYEHTTAEKFMFEKIAIVQKLRKYGVQTIHTKPEDLTVNSINKYLEIKAKGLL